MELLVSSLFTLERTEISPTRELKSFTLSVTVNIHKPSLIAGNILIHSAFGFEQFSAYSKA